MCALPILNQLSLPSHFIYIGVVLVLQADLVFLVNQRRRAAWKEEIPVQKQPTFVAEKFVPDYLAFSCDGQAVQNLSKLLTKILYIVKSPQKNPSLT